MNWKQHLHKHRVFYKVVLLVVVVTWFAGSMILDVNKYETMERNKNEIKILVKWGQIGGKLGPAGEIPNKYEVVKLVNPEGKTGYFIEFQKAGIVTSEKGTYFIKEAIFFKWLENFSELGFPTSDPYPDYQPDDANLERI